MNLIRKWAQKVKFTTKEINPLIELNKTINFRSNRTFSLPIQVKVETIEKHLRKLNILKKK